MTNEYPLLHRAVRFLSSRCDGALSEDGLGFNRMDTQFGHKLAALEEWTPKQAHAAWRMLRKYRGQLEDAGIFYDAIPEPEVPKESEERVLEVKDGRLALMFPFNEEVLADVKALPWRRAVPPEEGGWYWQPGTKHKEDLEALEELVDEWDFHVSGEAQDVIDAAWERAQKKEKKPSSRPRGPHFWVKDGELAVSFPYDPNLVSDVKHHFSTRRWDGNEKAWVLGGNGDLLDEVDEWLEIHPEFELTDEAADWLDERLEEADAKRKLSQQDDADFMKDYESASGYRLRPFQRAGVKYAAENDRVFIADEMGLGKTIQGLVTLEAKEAYPAVVVVPKRLKLNWVREAKEWVPHRKVRILEGTTPVPLGDADIYVMNYAMLSRDLTTKVVDGKKRKVPRDDGWVAEFRKHNLKAFVADESHALKNKDSNRSKAAAELASGVPIRLLLTGTPILNRPEELVQQLKVLGRLGEFGGFWNFVHTYCGAKKTRWGWDFTGATNIDQLNRRLRETCYVRRHKMDVLDELPPKERAVVPMDVDHAAYRAVEKEFYDWLRSADPESLAAQAMVRLEKLKQAAVAGKLEAAIEWVKGFIENEEKIVVFAIHKDVVARLKEEFPDAALLTTDQSDEEQEAHKRRFQEDDDCLVCIGAMGPHAGASPAGLGHTLTAAANAAFLELGWTPAHHEQCTDRTHRIGQERPVTAWYLTADGTVDEEIWQLLEKKREIVGGTTDGATLQEQDIRMDLLKKYMKDEGRDDDVAVLEGALGDAEGGSEGGRKYDHISLTDEPPTWDELWGDDVDKWED